MLFGIIGGDRRQEVLLELLRKDGYPAAAYGVAGEKDWEMAVSAEVVLLPLPLCREGDTLNIPEEHRGAGALFHQLRRDQLILAGQVQPAQAAEASDLGLHLIDYFKREELTVANAAATAEGDGPGDPGTDGPLFAGEPVSGAGLWPDRKAAEPPVGSHGGAGDGGGPPSGKPGLGGSLRL